MTWAPGQKLYGDRYIIEKLLGEGGFGIAYLAKDKKGNPVVIKTLNDKVLKDPQMADFRDKLLRDFRDEALRLALCQHPHIVKIDNAFNEGVLPCIAMEYIDGEDLRQRVKNRGSLEEAEALSYINQIGSAITVIHEKGLLHRDIKPQNIMLRSGKSEAVLIDFGIAREFIDNVTMKHTQALTPGFAPPEQYIKQAKRGEYTDVYALAATLYYLLTKTVPTDAYSRNFNVPLTPANQINPNISDEVNQAIELGMELAPATRPKLMQAWLELLPKQSVNQSPSPSELITQIPVEASYSKLRELLAAQKWKEADEQTALLMLRITCREQEGFLWDECIEQFPCPDLRTIDNLWVEYSGGQFGFSVQKRIWESIKEGKPDAELEIFERFGDRVGWRITDKWLEYHNIPFARPTPAGHFPWGFLRGGTWGVVGSGYIFSFLVQRLRNCNI